VDWTWVAVLYALCVSQALVPISKHSLLLRRTGIGRWRVIEPTEVFPRFQLMSVILMFEEIVQLSTPIDSAETPGAVITPAKSSRRAEAAVLVGRSLSFIQAACLVVGVPAATASYGVVGLVLTLCVVVNLTVVTSVAFIAIERLLRSDLVLPPRSERIQLHSPFAIPLAGALLRSRALQGVAAAEVLTHLVDETRLGHWLRPLQYDLIRVPETVPPHLRDIVAALSVPPSPSASNGAGADESYCPRCGAVFIRRVVCSDCGVELIAT
jgi:hypothetical protein